MLRLDDECVGLWITRDADEVGRLLDRRLEADPVRATLLGTIRLTLDTARLDCWCAATRDGSAVAVRSDRRYPVVLDGVWLPTDLDELATAIASLPGLAGVHGAVSTAEAVAVRLPGRAVNSRAIRLHRLHPHCHSRCSRPIPAGWHQRPAAASRLVSGIRSGGGFIQRRPRRCG